MLPTISIVCPSGGSLHTACRCDCGCAQCCAKCCFPVECGGGGGSVCCEPSRQVGNEESRRGLSLERSAETALGTRGQVLADCNGVSQRSGQPEPGDKWGSTTEQSQLPGLRRICAHCAIEVECRTRCCRYEWNWECISGLVCGF